jgi:hypothetical protein
MRAFSASELLTVWEQGQDKSLPERGLALLVAACPEYPKEALSKLSIGRRDARLLRLREWLFGPQIVSLARIMHEVRSLRTRNHGESTTCW